MSQSCSQTSQSHYPVACGLIKKFYDDYDVVFMCHKCNTVMPTGKFICAILCFLLPFLHPIIGHHSSATAATAGQPPEQQAIMFGRPAENDFKIGTLRDKMKYRAI